MKGCFAEMPSYTYALKSQRLLRSRGFSCDISRTERGCGYRLRIHRNCTEALSILDSYDIPYRTDNSEVDNYGEL